MAADDIVKRAVDLVFKRLSLEGYDSLAPAQKVLVCVWAACGEIDNGGFDQYFFNTSGDWAMDTASAFVAIRANGLASMIRKAVEQFPKGGPSRDRSTRQRQLDNLPLESQFELLELNSQFDTREVDDLLVAFVEANMEEVFRKSDA